MNLGLGIKKDVKAIVEEDVKKDKVEGGIENIHQAKAKKIDSGMAVEH